MTVITNFSTEPENKTLKSEMRLRNSYSHETTTGTQPRERKRLIPQPGGIWGFIVKTMHIQV